MPHAPAVDAGDPEAARAMDALRRLVRALHVSTRTLERELGVSAAQLFVLRQGRGILERAPITVQERLIAGLDALDPIGRRALLEGIEAWLALAGLDDVPSTMFFEPSV